MTTKPNLLFAIFSLCVAGLAIGTSAQNAQEQTPKLAVVKGQFEQSEYARHQVEFSEFQIKLVEQIVLPDVEPPANWDQMTPRQRVEYLEAFKKSAEGKALIAKREQMLAERNIFDVKIEKDGKWVVYDVPVGRYGIVNGRLDKEVEGRKFAYELFGQFQVSEKVEEVVLDPIKVLVTPLLAAGEQAPDFKVKSGSGLAFLSLDQFRGKFVLVYFWSADSEPSLTYFAEIQKMVNEVKNKQKIELVCINLDEEPRKAAEVAKEKQLKGYLGYAKGLDSKAAQDYGVRSLPSQWLIGPQGQLVLTNFDFRRLGITGDSLSKIVLDAIQGKTTATAKDK